MLFRSIRIFIKRGTGAKSRDSGRVWRVLKWSAPHPAGIPRLGTGPAFYENAYDDRGNGVRGNGVRGNGGNGVGKRGQAIKTSGETGSGKRGQAIKTKWIHQWLSLARVIMSFNSLA